MSEQPNIDAFNKAWAALHEWEKQTGPDWYRELDVQKWENDWRIVMKTVRDVSHEDFKEAVRRALEATGEGK